MNEHPITPPPELVEKWYQSIPNDSTSWKQQLATQAAQWGADQELEACCEWLECNYNYPRAGHPLRLARRPQTPSLKEQAFDALHGIHDQGPTPEQVAIIRRALEALDD
jgi:hypothetical protein